MSYSDVRRAILLVALLYLAFRFIGAVTAILFVFFAVFVLAMALNPIVTWLTRHRVPRFAAAILIALLLIVAVALLGWIVIPPMVQEAQDAIQQAPEYWNRAEARLEGLGQRVPFLRERLSPGGDFGRQLVQYGTTILTRAGSFTVTAAGVLFTLALVFILTIYTLASPRPILAGLLGAVPGDYREPTRSALIRIVRQMRAWVIASLILGAVVAFLAWLGLTLLGVPNALLLATLAFFGEFVPNFGPIVAAIPALLLALTVSPITALWTLVIYVIIQQVESYLLAPLILGGRLELHPVTVAFFVLVMGALVGVVGALLAVPVAAIVKILYEEFYYKPRHPDQEAIDHDAEAVLAA